MAAARHPVRRAVGTAASTSIGVGLGVLLGGYLTAVSGSGAPGVRALDAADIALLPLASTALAFALVFAVALVFSAMRRGRS